MSVFIRTMSLHDIFSISYSKPHISEGEGVYSINLFALIK